MEIRIQLNRADGEKPNEDQINMLIRLIEGFLGHRPGDVVRSAREAGWEASGLQAIGEPSQEMAEWRRVALDKWRHFRQMYIDYEAGKVPGMQSISLDFHAYGLAKVIPYLLGVPDEALPDQQITPKQQPSFQLGQGYVLGPTKNPNEFRVEPRHPEAFRLGDPHHHEERMPAYPVAGLDFTDAELPGMWEKADFDEVRQKPVPDAFEHGEARTIKPSEQQTFCPTCKSPAPWQRNRVMVGPGEGYEPKQCQDEWHVR